MELNEYGRILAEEWQRSSTIRQEIELDKFVIMPNHIHGIVTIQDVGANGRSPKAGRSAESLRRLKSKYETLYPVVPISSTKKEGLEELRMSLFENARIIRVYSKEPGKEPDRDTPFVLPLGSTVLDLAEMIHRDFLHNLKYACIWGSAKFGGQRVQKDYVIHDRDVVEYHL